MYSVFNGFSSQTIQFLSELENNNTKNWFEANRHIFDDYVISEAKNFVITMGQKLQDIAPGIVAIPKIDKSIFRLHRDVRFSKDKSPYKTHIGVFFWEGPGKKLENPGFYFHLEHNRLFLGVGLHMFPKHILSAYRDAVVDEKLGPELYKIIEDINKNKNYKLGWEKYKKTPRGYDDKHPNATYLLHGGLGFEYESIIPAELYSGKLLNLVYTVFKDMYPIHFWLLKMINRFS